MARHGIANHVVIGPTRTLRVNMGTAPSSVDWSGVLIKLPSAKLPSGSGDEGNRTPNPCLANETPVLPKVPEAPCFGASVLLLRPFCEPIRRRFFDLTGTWGARRRSRLFQPDQSGVAEVGVRVGRFWWPARARC